MKVHRKIPGPMQSHPFCPSLCLGIRSGSGACSSAGGALLLLLLLLLLPPLLLLPAVQAHVVSWAGAVVALICLQRRAQAAAFWLFLTVPFEKAFPGCAGARGMLWLRWTWRAQGQPEQQGCAPRRHLGGLLVAERGQRAPAIPAGQDSSANLNMAISILFYFFFRSACSKAGMSTFNELVLHYGLPVGWKRRCLPLITLPAWRVCLPSQPTTP